MKNLMVAATIALTTLGTAGSAATVDLDFTTSEALTATTPIGQDFVPQLAAAGVTNLFSGPLSLIGGPSIVEFTLVGAESGFSNALKYNGDVVVAEAINNASGAATGDFLTGQQDGGLGQNSFVTKFDGGDLAELLSFQILASMTTFDAQTDNFGIFADASMVDNLSVFFLALDDTGANDDDNHDDIIVRVELSAVPVPASGLLLLGALGGLAGMRRRMKA